MFHKLKQMVRFITDSDFRFECMNYWGLTKKISDEKFLQKIFKIRLKKNLNLKNPQTYNEKLQWLKLYDRNPLYTQLVDKYAVKKWVAEKIGIEYIIPTLGIWNHFDEIHFNELPEKFVLKCTHDSGGVIIVKDKRNFDISIAKKIINKSLRKNFFWFGREWPYKNVVPCIIAEKYMEDESGCLKDYKFFCFNGVVRALFIASDRQNPHEETKFDFFDRNFNHLPFTNGHPNAKNIPPKPRLFEKMINIAEQLSIGIPHVRVDLYEINGKIYFGEMTFSHWSGLTSFQPNEWDYKFGEWLTLPKKIS